MRFAERNSFASSSFICSEDEYLDLNIPAEADQISEGANDIQNDKAPPIQNRAANSSKTKPKKKSNYKLPSVKDKVGRRSNSKAHPDLLKSDRSCSSEEADKYRSQLWIASESNLFFSISLTNHNNESNISLRCCQCDERFENVYALSEHLACEHHNPGNHSKNHIGNETEKISYLEENGEEKVNIDITLEAAEKRWLKKIKEIRYESQKPGEAKCSICTKVFWSHKYLETVHMVIAHPDKDYTVVCEDCGRVCKNKYELNDHRHQKHREKRKYRKYTKEPDLSLRNRLKNCSDPLAEQWCKHMEKIDRGYMCRHCGFSAPKRPHMEDHIIGKHREFIDWNISDRLKRCPECDYSTYRMSALWLHKRYKHQNTENMELLCPHCGFKTNRSSSLKQHIFYIHDCKREENKDKFLMCSYCEFKTLRKQTLQNHVSYIHEGVPRPQPEGKRHACKQCDFRTKHVCNLISHVKGVHQGIKRIRKKNKPK